jgi:hypothetical protein
MSTCDVEGCDKSPRGNQKSGLCAMHYHRKWRHGDVNADMRPGRKRIPCRKCGALFNPPCKSYTTCRECTPRRIPPRNRVYKCAACGVEFQPPIKKRKCCDDCAASRAWLPKRGRPKYPSHVGRGNSGRGRVKQFGVEYEPVDRRKVFARDRWRCGICHKPVDKSLKWPHPMSATLDHIVPMSMGGGHTYANTQCSHATCNIRKSNGGHGEQLALIG